MKKADISMFKTAVDPRRRSNSAGGFQLSSKERHQKLANRRSSESSLPATDDEDEIFEITPFNLSSTGRKNRFKANRPWSFDHYASVGNRGLERLSRSTHEETQIDGSESRTAKAQLNSFTGTFAVDPQMQNQHLDPNKIGSRTSDLPATDDEDEMFEERPTFSPGRTRERFQAFLGAATRSSIRNDISIKPLSENQTVKSKREGLLQIPTRAKLRSYSTSLIPEHSGEHHLPDLGQSSSSVSNLHISDEEDEIFEATLVDFSYRPRRDRFQALSSSVDAFTPRGSYSELDNHAKNSPHAQESEMDKPEQEDIEDRNALQISTESKRRSRANSAVESSKATNPHQHPKLCKRRSSESDVQEIREEHRVTSEFFSNGRRRAQTFHTPNDYFIHRSGKLTENAKKLSQEEIHSLEIDIFKPLDFFELLFERMKITSHRNATEAVHSLE